jgi:hypothetical protein
VLKTLAASAKPSADKSGEAADKTAS